MWDVWKKLFLECVEKHAPLRTKRVRSSNSSWITPQLKKKNDWSLLVQPWASDDLK